MDRRRERTGSEPAARTMRVAPDPEPEPDGSTVYHVRVRGHLDDRWAARRDGTSVTRDESGDTVLTVPIVDQADLHGLLRQLRDLGVPLVSITPAGADLPGIASKEEQER